MNQKTPLQGLKRLIPMVVAPLMMTSLSAS
jgi:hypothetical protein